MRRAGLFVFALIVFGVALALVLENLSGVSIHYLFGTATLPLAALLAAALILGALLGAACTLPTIFKARAKVRRAKGRLAQVEKELSNLRRVPLRDAR